MKPLVAGIVPVLLVLLVACGFGATPTPAPTPTPVDSPERGAREWYEAIANSDGLRMDDRTCAAQKEAVRQSGLMTTAFSTLGQLLIGKQEIKVDVSGLAYTRVGSGSDSTDIRVVGTVRTAIGLSVQSQAINQTMRMVRENGKWKYCGQAGVAQPTQGLNQTLCSKSARGAVNLFTRKQFSKEDLARLVLQPSEAPFPPGVFEGNMDRYREQGAKDFTVVVYSGQGGFREYIISAAVTFPDSNVAIKALSAIIDGKVAAIDSTFIRAKNAVTGLGEEGYCVETWNRAGEPNTVEYNWRTGNVILVLFALPSPTLTGTDITALAEKMQSHAQ